MHHPSLRSFVLASLLAPLGSALLPSLAGLPEGVDSATYAAVYGGVEGAGMRQLTAELGRRLDTLALYR